MTTSAAPDDGPPARIGRPPKVDRDGTPTRERLLRAAADACVEFGYEGATLSDIARRAEVSTPAIYSHFSGKAELLVEACQRELNTISSSKLREVEGLRELSQFWIQPEFGRSRIIVAEIHCAAIRQPDVAELLGTWQQSITTTLENMAGLTTAQAQQLFLILIGLAHLDQVKGIDVSAEATEAEVSAVLEGWLGDRYLDR
ncbi:TetR/AcrR family transcriptional regulator [Ilumatobacter nonamiensis]|uniref:TetR/AcrR family transcriptional regulator n=1 Tax=Ilumatobacter nonamiensis TaxID=467093 RepID=UPI00034D7409|nr:TetR/AcrR family transcriptional regulator [Ilumatobacter nonamiensis]